MKWIKVKEVNKFELNLLALSTDLSKCMFEFELDGDIYLAGLITLSDLINQIYDINGDEGAEELLKDVIFKVWMKEADLPKPDAEK